MNKETLIDFKNELLERTDIKTLMDEDYRSELVRLFVVINDILNLTKMPKGIGSNYTRINKLKKDALQK